MRIKMRYNWIPSIWSSYHILISKNRENSAKCSLIWKIYWNFAITYFSSQLIVSSDVSQNAWWPYICGPLYYTYPENKRIEFHWRNICIEFECMSTFTFMDWDFSIEWSLTITKSIGFILWLAKGHVTIIPFKEISMRQNVAI